MSPRWIAVALTGALVGAALGSAGDAQAQGKASVTRGRQIIQRTVPFCRLPIVPGGQRRFARLVQPGLAQFPGQRLILQQVTVELRGLGGRPRPLQQAGRLMSQRPFIRWECRQ